MKFNFSAFLLSQLAFSKAKHLTPSSPRALDGGSFEECTLLIKVVDNIEGPDEQFLECGLSDGRIFPFSAIPSWLERDFAAGNIRSNEDVLRVSEGGAQILEDKIVLQSDASTEVTRQENVQNQQNVNTSDKKTLVLHVTALDISTTYDMRGTVGSLADEVFGTEGTVGTLQDQMLACSFGKINFAPFDGEASSGAQVVQGVFGVSIDINANGVSSGTVASAVTSAGNTALGTMSSQFDFVLYCLPDGVNFGGAAAWAYLNHWQSAYMDSYCKYMNVQMHEIGHNLGLGHSGEGTAEYDDISGMMGASYGGGHNKPIQCFNGPRSYQLGWYSDRHVNLSGPYVWEGKLYGIADYGTTTASEKMILKLGDNSDIGMYISFNRKTGVNAETLEYGDRVMVHSGGSSDATATWIQATLTEGEIFDVSINGGTIPLKFIGTGTDSGGRVYADIELGNLSPTTSPTPCVGSNIEVIIQMDRFPGDISWVLLNVDDNNIEIGSGGSYTSPSELLSYDFCVSDMNCFDFVIADSYGDGLCCSNGEGYYEVKADGVQEAYGAQFGSGETTNFCLSSPPTSSAPSDIPSNTPSDIPSNTPSESNPGPSPPTPNGPWFIELKPDVDPVVDEDSLVAVYDARDATHEVKVYEADCATEVSGVFPITTDKTTPVAGEMELTVGLGIDIDAIKSSPFYTDNNDGTGIVDFCVEASLWSGTNKVVAHKTVYAASLTEVEGFFTLQDVTLFEDNPTEIDDIDIGYSGQVLVYQCNPDTLIEIAQPTPLSAGEELTVCVENEDASTVVSAILEMDLFQISGGVTLDFGVITGGQVVSSNEALIDSGCSNGICYASIVLIDAFFQDGATTFLDVTGEALLGSGKEEAENPFSLSVDLESCDGGLISSIMRTIWK